MKSSFYLQTRLGCLVAWMLVAWLRGCVVAWSVGWVGWLLSCSTCLALPWFFTLKACDASDQMMPLGPPKGLKKAVCMVLCGEYHFRGWFPGLLVPNRKPAFAFRDPVPLFKNHQSRKPPVRPPIPDEIGSTTVLSFPCFEFQSHPIIPNPIIPNTASFPQPTPEIQRIPPPPPAPTGVFAKAKPTRLPDPSERASEHAREACGVRRFGDDVAVLGVRPDVELGRCLRGREFFFSCLICV